MDLRLNDNNSYSNLLFHSLMAANVEQGRAALQLAKGAARAGSRAVGADTLDFGLFTVEARC